MDETREREPQPQPRPQAQAQSQPQPYIVKKIRAINVHPTVITPAELATVLTILENSGWTFERSFGSWIIYSRHEVATPPSSPSQPASPAPPTGGPLPGIPGIPF